MSALKCLSILLLGWAASTLLAEAAFRIIGDTPSFDLQGLYEPFGDGGYKLRPNVDTEAYWASGHFSIHMDALGLRSDRARQLGTKPGDILDVLLIGDSQGFGNGVSFEESLAGSLAIRAAQEGFKIGNASVGGHSLINQLEVAQFLFDHYRIRAKHYVMLLTPVMMHTCDEQTHVIVGDDGRLYGEGVSLSALARVWVKRHVVLYARARDALRRTGIGVDPARETFEIFQLYRAGVAESELQEKFLRCVSRFQELTRYANAQIHFVYVPLTIESDFEPIRRAAELQGLSIDRNLPSRVCLAVSKELNMSFYTLRPTLESLYQRKDEVHLTGDFHYSRKLSIASSNDLWAQLRTELLNEKSSRANR